MFVGQVHILINKYTHCDASYNNYYVVVVWCTNDSPQTVDYIIMCSLDVPVLIQATKIVIH